MFSKRKVVTQLQCGYLDAYLHTRELNIKMADPRTEFLAEKYQT